MAESYNKTGSYGKRPMWQWVLIYIVIGGIIYGLIYYFVFAKKGGYSTSIAPSSNNQVQQGSQNPSTQPKNEQKMASTTIEYKQGFSPKTITVKVGTTVTWVNKDTDLLQVASNPHPTHTDYPALNSVGLIKPGESKSFTFPVVGKSGYHNHLEPDKTGEVVVEQ